MITMSIKSRRAISDYPAWHFPVGWMRDTIRVQVANCRTITIYMGVKNEQG